jgi:hypothetical protein
VDILHSNLDMDWIVAHRNNSGPHYSHGVLPRSRLNSFWIPVVNGKPYLVDRILNVPILTIYSLTNRYKEITCTKFALW